MSDITEREAKLIVENEILKSESSKTYEDGYIQGLLDAQSLSGEDAVKTVLEISFARSFKEALGELLHNS